ISIDGLPDELPCANERLKHRAIELLQNGCKRLPADKTEGVVDQLALAASVEVPINPPTSMEPLTWDGARELERSGLQFGAHSVTHNMLSMMSDQQCEYEISESWARLNEELSNPSPIFGWPTGTAADFGNREINVAKKIGLIGAVATVPGNVPSNQTIAG